METSVGSATTSVAKQLVTIHFSDGHVQDAVLHSGLLKQNTVRFAPQIPASDRRKHPRVPYINEVQIDQLGTRRVTDISNGGLYVECLTPYPPQMIIPIFMKIGNESFCIETRVAFLDPGIGMGLEFYRVPPTIRLKLEAMIQAIIQGAGQTLMTSRRGGSERRSDKSPTRNLRIRRYTTDRRQTAAPATEAVEAELFHIKSIFFKSGLKLASPKGSDVVIEFLDGEELHVRLFDIAQEPQGFFAEYRVSDSVTYPVYVVRSAVKNIQCLV